jgi:hypothetical protein
MRDLYKSMSMRQTYALPRLSPPHHPHVVWSVPDDTRGVLVGSAPQCLGRGLSNADVAAEPGITGATAKTHVSRVLAKLGATSRVQAAIAARTAGLA